MGLEGNEREAHRQILALGAGAADEVSELLLQNDNYVSAVVEFIFIEYTLVYDDASEEVLTLVYGSQYEIRLFLFKQMTEELLLQRNLKNNYGII